MNEQIQPLPWKWEADKDHDRLFLVTTEERPERLQMNDPVVLAVREDWIGYLLNTPQGKAHMKLILEGVNNHEMFRRLLLGAVVALEFGEWNPTKKAEWLENARKALKLDVCGL